MSTKSLTVGTDGACLRNPGPAGWAWVDEHGNAHSSGQALGTNQIAELNAVLQALRDHRNVPHLIIQTDSTYARDCSTTWRPGWERNGMRNSKKKPVANADIIRSIWEALDARTGALELSSSRSPDTTLTTSSRSTPRPISWPTMLPNKPRQVARPMKERRSISQA